MWPGLQHGQTAVGLPDHKIQWINNQYMSHIKYEIKFYKHAAMYLLLDTNN